MNSIRSTSAGRSNASRLTPNDAPLRSSFSPVKASRRTWSGSSVSRKHRHSGGLSSGGFSLQPSGMGPKVQSSGYLKEYPYRSLV